MKKTKEELNQLKKCKSLNKNRKMLTNKFQGNDQKEADDAEVICLESTTIKKQANYDYSVENTSKSLAKLNISDEEEIATTPVSKSCRDLSDINMINGLIQFMSHSIDCPPNSVEITEKRYGLETILDLFCRWCKKTCVLRPQPLEKVKMSINEAAVKGALAIGLSCAELNQFLSCICLNTLSAKIFQKYSNIPTTPEESEPINKELIENASKLDVNEATVLGAISIGMDCSRMNILFSFMEIPAFSQDMFDEYFNRYYQIYKENMACST